MEVWICYYHDGEGYEIGEPEDSDKSLLVLLERHGVDFGELQTNLKGVAANYYSEEFAMAFMKIIF